MGQPTKRGVAGSSIENIRQNCVIDGEHWIWKGAVGGGSPRVWAPDLGQDGKLVSMTVARAVWQLRTGKPVPNGQRAYRMCTVDCCVSPKCTGCGTPSQWGKAMAKEGRFSSTAGAIARAKLGRRMRSLTDTQIMEIQASSETAVELAPRYGCGPDVISKARKGYYKISSPFAGLMQRGP